MPKSDVELSKFLSLVLRHKPEEIGITLDAAGWVDVDELLDACAKRSVDISRKRLESIVESSDKKRFAFNQDQSRIRANQGHSVSVELGYLPVTPPEVLYHGTATRFLESITATGLMKQQRSHVHLSADVQTAANVGQRHGRLALLEVNTAQMKQDGYLFYLSDNGVWLTDNVPAKYLRLLES